MAAYDAHNMNMHSTFGACQCSSTGFFATPACAPSNDETATQTMRQMNFANGYIYGVDLLGALLFCLFALLLNAVLVASLVLVHIYAVVIIISIIIRITEPKSNKRETVPLGGGDIL